MFDERVVRREVQIASTANSRIQRSPDLHEIIAEAAEP
jgi:hypothetical protein